MATTLELINEILQELGYRTKDALSDLTTREELDIKRKLKNLNTEVLHEMKISPRKRSTKISVPANITEIKNLINGEVLLEPGGIIDESKKLTYKYNKNHQDFLLGNTSETDYSVFADKLLFTPQSYSRTLTVYYYTFDTAQTDKKVDKAYLEDETDTSLIPTGLQQKVLVNGVCFELKKRSNNTRVPFWQSEYIDGRNQLRSYSVTQDEEPKFTVGAEQYSFVRDV
jgi:hypothetical protein